MPTLPHTIPHATAQNMPTLPHTIPHATAQNMPTLPHTLPHATGTGRRLLGMGRELLQSSTVPSTTTTVNLAFGFAAVGAGCAACGASLRVLVRLCFCLHLRV